MSGHAESPHRPRASDVMRWGGRGLVLMAAVAIGAALRPHVGAWVQARQRAAGPAAPKLPNLYAAKAGQFEALDQGVTGSTIVYLGDSITDWIHIGEFLQWPGGRVLNRSISGDTTAGVLERVQRSFPRDVVVCVIMIGYNDISQGDRPADVAARIGRIARFLLDHRAVQHVVVEALLPAPEPWDAPLRAVNRELHTLEADPRISCLDVHDDFLLGDQPDPQWFSNSVHLSAAGVRRRLEREVAHLAAIRPDLGLTLTPATGG